MHYEPIKHRIDRIISANPFLKKTFFKVLDLYLLRTWHIHKALRNYFSGKTIPLSIFDAGAGFGQYSYYISRTYPKAEITALDISQSHVDKVNDFFQKINNKSARFVQGDLTQFVQPNSFDLIISVDVMEHIEDDRKVFENFYQSLKKGGMLLVSTPSDQGGSDVHDHDSDSSFIDEHVRDGYSIADITEKLQTAGFSSIEANYTYGKPGQISWKFLMKYPVTMVNKSKLLTVLLPFYLFIFFIPCFILNYLDVSGKHKSGTGLMVKAYK